MTSRKTIPDQSGNQKSQEPRSKPPNVLIYCKPSEFVQIKKTVLTIINPDRYAVYHLDDSKITTTPWAENTELLVIKTNKLTERVAKTFLLYHKNGGNLFSFYSNFCHYFLFNKILDIESEPVELNEIEFKNLKVKLLCPNLDKPFIVRPESNLATLAVDLLHKTPVIFARKASSKYEGNAALSLVDLEYDPERQLVRPEWTLRLKENDSARMEILREIFSKNLGMDCTHTTSLPLTPCYVHSESIEKEIMMRRLQKRIKDNQLVIGRDLTLEFCSCDQSSKMASETFLPVFMDPDWSKVFGRFHADGYTDNLKTNVLGRIALYCEVMPTTMNVADGLSDCPEVVVIARRQTQGKGRGGNAWLSPDGCAMFSFPLSIRADSKLGRSPTWVQHISALAMIEGILNMPGYEELDLKIKWPNDVYLGSDKTKIGGLLVQSTVSNHEIRCVVGCGLNVSNSVPTSCVNDLIVQHNFTNGTQLEPLQVDQVIARVLSQVEELVEQFQHCGYEPIKKLYLDTWMHGYAQVTVENEGEAKIVGIDEFGFLKVELENGRKLSLQPDGNSFDLMRNLITVKKY